MERQRVIVDTSSGKLRGSFERSCLGDDYYAFKGIPYAKQPVGQLRFQDPQSVEPWTEIRDATTHGPISAQYDAQTKKVIGSEDCLYLNVYSRNLNATSRAPVMFWIHGGAFHYGSGNDNMFGPDFLLAKNLVLVTINYRLGIFGFLNLENKTASGNQGLKDQVMALKWVRNNIINFGGDPENVTIFGASAGAASVHYLTMSQMAKGLFQKAICQSWTALAPYTITREPNRDDLFEYLERLDCQKKDSEVVLLARLKSVSFERLIEVQEELTTCQRRLRGRYLFLPTIDDKSEQPFLPISSAEAAKRGVQVPLMLGWNGKEGLVYMNSVKKLDLSDVDRHLDNYTSPFIDELLQRNNLTFKELRYLYLKNDKITEKTLSDILAYYGDIMFVENVHRLAKIQVNTSSAATYLYKLSFEKNLSLSKMQLNTTIKGPNHGDELMYLFRANVCDSLKFEQLQEGTGGDRVMRQMVELWTNFAKTGRPTLEKSELLPLFWQPVMSDVVLRYLNIDQELRMERTLNIEQRYSYKSNDMQIDEVRVDGANHGDEPMYLFKVNVYDTLNYEQLQEETGGDRVTRHMAGIIVDEFRENWLVTSDEVFALLEHLLGATRGGGVES